MASADPTTSPACPRCGAVPGPEAVRGLCPRCLARCAFGDDADSSAGLPAALSALRGFGDYELIEEIARGGMGVVFRARQISLGREVALKLLRDGALAGEDEVRRFRAEASAAAVLQHPNIVAVHEIGEHEGQQYLAMRLVEGRDLAAWTRDGPVSIQQAAEWLEAVARAVEHAHSRGVLHRDLKPSNILVDAEGRPQVTDFGFARRVDLATGLTLTGQVIGTPGYLSPEQAAGRSREVGRTSDVYGLGAVLYHLLTGRPPFTGESPTAVLRQVEERDPVGPRLLNPAVPRDLETVTLKALSKDPARRYPTALAMAEDIARFRRGEPIQARPVSAAERAWRWTRRNPATAALSATILLLLATFMAVQTASNLRLDRQRRQAEEVKGFLTEVLSSPDPTKDGRQIRVLDLLDRARQRAETHLAGQPEVQAEVFSTLGVTYYQLSLYEQAEPLLRRALEAYVRRSGPDSVRAGEARAHLGSLLVWAGRQAEGEIELGRAVQILRRHQPSARQELSSALAEWGSALLVIGRHAEALSPLRECIAICRRIGPPADQTLASAIGDLSTTLGALGQREESMALNEESIAINRRIPDGKVNLATCLSNHSDWLARMGRFDEAIAAAEEALTLREGLFGAESSPVAFSQSRLAQVLNQAGRHAEALERSDRAVDLAGRALSPRHRDFQFHLRQRGTALLRLGRSEEAVVTLGEAAGIAVENFGPGHPSARHNRCLLAEALAAVGRREEARDLLSTNLSVVEEEAKADPNLASGQARLRHLSALLERLGGPR